MCVDRSVEPFFDIATVLGSCVICELCGAFADYTSEHPRRTDENYYDQARVMQQRGWHVLGRLEVVCPDCAANVELAAGRLGRHARKLSPR